MSASVHLSALVVVCVIVSASETGLCQGPPGGGETVTEVGEGEDCWKPGVSTHCSAKGVTITQTCTGTCIWNPNYNNGQGQPMGSFECPNGLTYGEKWAVPAYWFDIEQVENNETGQLNQQSVNRICVEKFQCYCSVPIPFPTGDPSTWTTVTCDTGTTQVGQPTTIPEVQPSGGICKRVVEL